jgi:hypothetical protein
MKLADFDVDTTDGTRPIAQALEWLEALISSPGVPWAPFQREAAAGVLIRAKYVLASDVAVSTEEGEACHVARVEPQLGSLH